MKNLILKVTWSLTGVLLMLMVLAASHAYDPGPRTAEVERVNGLYVFTDSTPVMQHEKLGTVEHKGTWSASVQYTDVRQSLIKKVLKKYPQADGVILFFDASGADMAHAIKF